MNASGRQMQPDASFCCGPQKSVVAKKYALRMLAEGVSVFRGLEPHEIASDTDYLVNPLPMARKSSAFRAAPPIRPPSTSSLAKISAAFEGLHEPP